MKKNLQIGQVLIEKGLINEQQLDRALELQKKTTGKRLGDLLVELGYISESSMLEALAERLNVPFADLKTYPVNTKAATLLPREAALRTGTIPIDFKNDMLVVATADPLNFHALEEVSTYTGYQVFAVVAMRQAILQTISRCYGDATVSEAVSELDRQTNIRSDRADNVLADMEDRVEGTPVAQVINKLLAHACSVGATDIHIEPTRTTLNIRLRINGELTFYNSMNMANFTPIVSRIKLQSGMDIAERRIPQDGKFSFSGEGFSADVRVSSLPTVYGEKVVLRLLGNSLHPELLDLSRLGMDPDTYEKFERMIKAPNGIILVAGPTGSGKSTTLYAALSQLSKRKANLITIEDPVEQRIDSVNQVQVNTKAGLTFAAALRSILRQDPDIIMVGEMRDSETASLGIRAAITGHLVFSTIHTNDSASTVARLVDMGVEPYLVAAALSGVVAQRLVATLCPDCKKPHILAPYEKKVLGLDPDTPAGEVYEADGCPRCNYTGYIGRKPIYELLYVDGNLRDLIAENAPAHEIRKIMKENGNKFLENRVAEMVLQGETDLTEAGKVLYTVL